MPEKHIRKFDSVRMLHVEQFRVCFGFLGHTAHPFLPDSIFRLADSDRDGHITFEQFATIMDIYHNGSADEKSEFSFGLLDESGDGVITYEEMRHVMQKFMAHWASLLGQRMRLDEDNLRSIFEQMVPTGSEQLTMKQYKKMIKRKPDLINWNELLSGQCATHTHSLIKK